MEDSGIAVQSAGDKGKGLFATKFFKEGEIIFQELPIVSCQFSWNSEYGYLACDHCMKPLETAEENLHRLSMNTSLTLPYPDCCVIDKEQHRTCPFCYIKYCSEECKSLAWVQYHKTLCTQSKEKPDSHPLMLLETIWKESHYPPETSTIMLLVRMAAVIQQAEDKESMRQTMLQFCHRTADIDKGISHKLLRRDFVQNIHVLREAFKNCVNPSHIEDWLTNDGFLSMLALIGTNGQGIGTSSISEWVKNATSLNLNDEDKMLLDKFIDEMYEQFDKAVGEFLNNEGIGLYSLQSCSNHSCTPNAETNFPDNNYKLVMVAKRDILPGEELCVSYLDECMLESSRHTRQKYLLNNYLFRCACEKCLLQSTDPDVTSDEHEDEIDEDVEN